MALKNALEDAYAHCQAIASAHYENFPVASILLPKHLRRPISAIYAFARTADDFADEGDSSKDVRLNALNNYLDALHQIKNQSFSGNNPIFIALADTIKQHNLDIQLFKDLLIAFKQDVTKSRYQTHKEVLTYCKHSANPIGRLLLQLHGYSDKILLQQSDAICTALQLINFYQDIQDDHQNRNRIYLPQDEMEKHHISEQELGLSNTSNLATLLQQQYQHVTELITIGAPLGGHLKGRFGWEIRTTILAAATLLNTLKNRPSHHLLQRPTLSKWQLSKITLLSLNKKSYLSSLSVT